MDIDVRHLKLVVSVAGHGSLTRAANELHLTQSALSHQLREVESRLGTRIFFRVHRRMLLTAAGERLLNTARAVLDEIRRAEDDLRALTTERQGVLRISTECYTCYHWLPQVLQKFRETYPRVEVRIDVDATAQPLGALLDGRLEIAFISFFPSRDRRVVLRPLFRDELVVLVAPGHPLSSRPYIDPQDLAAETLLTYAPREESQVYQRILLPAGVAPNVQQVRLTEAVIEMVRAGLGVAILARWAVQAHLRNGSLAAVPLTPRGTLRQWYAATPRHLVDVPYVDAFVALVAREALPAADVARPTRSGGKVVSMRRDRPPHGGRMRTQILPK